jgi:adenine-specific DNA-methyltransferase
MDTNGVKYIGSKRTLIPYILDAVKDIQPKTVIDVFTGTTRVAQAFRKSGWNVVSSDLSWASEAYANLFLMTTPEDIDILEQKVEYLNGIEGYSDWITRSYCDVRGEKDSVIRTWRPMNGEKADAIRNQIDTWETSGEITHHIAMSLVAILILAMDAVDNTVGVQQAYLKQWATRTSNPLKLKIPPGITLGDIGQHYVGNCLNLEYPSGTLAYLDPPYSTHSYATYYHIWDSVTRWDKPEVCLGTNRRKDRANGFFDESMRSDWNNKKTALKAFETLLAKLPVRYVLLSYSNESIVSLFELKKLLDVYSGYTVQEIDYKRNIMCHIGNATLYEKDEYNTKNLEYLILIDKGEVAQ